MKKGGVMDGMKKGIGFYARVIHNQIEKKSNSYLRDMGLTQTQGDVLVFIVFAKKKGKQIKQKDIEDYFHISNPTVSGLLDRLEQKDLIIRKKTPDDKRIHYIEPTEQGMALDETMFNIVKKTEQDMLDGIDPQTAEYGFEFLSQVFSNHACVNVQTRKETD